MLINPPGFPHRVVVIVVVIVFLGLRVFLLGGAPIGPGTVPLLLFATAGSLLLLASWSVVAALAVRAMGQATIFSLLHPAHVHGLWGADGNLLQKYKSANSVQQTVKVISH